MPFPSAERLVKLGAAEILSVDVGGPGKLPETSKTAESKPAANTSAPRQCAYVKKNGTRCTRESEPGKDYCRVCKLTVAKMAKRAQKTETNAPKSAVNVTVPPGIDPSLVPNGE